MPNSIMNISNDNLRDILSYLEIDDIYNFMQTSKECFAAVVSNGPKDHILKYIMPTEYGCLEGSTKRKTKHYMYVHKDAILVENVRAGLKCIIQNGYIFFVTYGKVFSKVVQLFDHYDHSLYALDFCYMMSSQGSYGMNAQNTCQMVPRSLDMIDPVTVCMNIMKFSLRHRYNDKLLVPYHIKIRRRPMFI